MTGASTENHVDQFLSDVVAGLSLEAKSIPCKYFYDEIGSQLFDQICELDEYYLTRTEHSIIRENARSIAEQVGTRAMLVEMGSGSSLKTRILLDHLVDPAAYVPVDISEEHLYKTADTLREVYPDLEILPVSADFTEGFELPQSQIDPDHAAIFFPGSTIGNFSLPEAKQLLDRFARIVGQSGGLVIGLDLVKDPQIIEAAYNDSLGVTARFNLNLLARINRELNGKFVIDQFAHRAIYNEELNRVEIGLVSQVDQQVEVGDETFCFARDEYIHTEFSHKYTIDGFTQLAAESGFALHLKWCDPREYFAILHFVVE